jgi:hypothetical protein
MKVNTRRTRSMVGFDTLNTMITKNKIGGNKTENTVTIKLNTMTQI